MPAMLRTLNRSSLGLQTTLKELLEKIMTIPRIILPLALAALVFPGAQLSTAQSTDAQSISTTPIAASASTAVPALVPFSGVALAADGKPMQSGTGITFMIFKD